MSLLLSSKEGAVNLCPPFLPPPPPSLRKDSGKTEKEFAWLSPLHLKRTWPNCKWLLQGLKKKNTLKTGFRCFSREELPVMEKVHLECATVEEAGRSPQEWDGQVPTSSCSLVGSSHSLLSWLTREQWQNRKVVYSAQDQSIYNRNIHIHMSLWWVHPTFPKLTLLCLLPTQVLQTFELKTDARLTLQYVFIFGSLESKDFPSLIPTTGQYPSDDYIK